MIRSFRDHRTKEVFERIYVKAFSSDLQRIALRKLEIINAATTLEDLRVPPGNRLEKLHGDREGQYSIRINDQFRVCFRWKDGDAHDVEIVDYHS
jgi:proteic killer suppression protein